MMNELLMFGYGFLAGAAVVAAWWFWIGHKAKIRAAEQTALAAAKKI